MIIVQYGKMIIWCLRKWVLHNLSIGSTLPNTKNFFLDISLGELCWLWDIKNGLPREVLGIGKHLQTHRRAAHQMGCICALFAFTEICRFQDQSTAISLLRDFKAAAKIQFFPEWIIIYPRKSHICRLKTSFYLF